jgi:diguanylate cyclase (GGDEF)-like protein
MTDRLPLVLAIDDTPANLLTLGKALGGEFDLQFATSGAAGVALAIESLPDLILLDVMMPDMDGYETCHRLLADPATRDIPIIFITAQNSPDDETRGLEAGALDFISKPVNPAVLRARVRTHLTMKRMADQLRSMALVDDLTGIANRRCLFETLENEWRVCQRVSAPLALAMIDIDHFKRVNDSYGHQSGDVCLMAVASALKACLGRPHDLIARYGGEEFICLFPGTDLAGAQSKAEELRQSVQVLGIPNEGASAAPVVTVSIGVAVTIPTTEMTPHQLVESADKQLYEAKRAGRNRICCVDFLKGSSGLVTK